MFNSHTWWSTNSLNSLYLHAISNQVKRHYLIHFSMFLFSLCLDFQMTTFIAVKPISLNNWLCSFSEEFFCIKFKSATRFSERDEIKWKYFYKDIERTQRYRVHAAGHQLWLNTAPFLEFWEQHAPMGVFYFVSCFSFSSFFSYSRLPSVTENI